MLLKEGGERSGRAKKGGKGGNVRSAQRREREALHVRRPNEGVEVEVGTVDHSLLSIPTRGKRKKGWKGDAQLHRERVQHVRPEPSVERKRSTLLQNL